MAGETTITTVGRFTKNPELRFTPSGEAVVNFTLATNSRHFDKATREWVQDDPAFLRCGYWPGKNNPGEGERFISTFASGDRVLATLTMKPNNYEQEGVTITGLKWIVEEIAPTFRFGTYAIERKAGTH